MNVGPPGEDSKGSPSNSPPPSVVAPAAELVKYEHDSVAVQQDDSTDGKLPSKTTGLQDAIIGPEKPSEDETKEKKKKKRTWKKPEVSG